MKKLNKKQKKKLEELSIEDFFKECISMANNKRKVIEVEEDGLIGRTYEDLFLGEWVGNFEVIKDGEVVMHSTLTSAYETEEECRRALKMYNLLREEVKGE